MVRNNKGFSLVELVVALGILGVLGVSLVGFLMSGTNNFNRSNSTVNLQYEQQLAVNQIRDLIVESSSGLYFDGTSQVLTIYDTKEYESGAAKYPVSFISLEGGKLYYSSKKFDAVGDIDFSSVTDKYLLAEYVADFTADLSKVDDGKVQFTITFTRGNTTQVAMETVALRNRVVASNVASEIWEPDPDVMESFIDTVTISRGITDFPQNGTDSIGKVGSAVEVNYSATVTASNEFSTRDYAVSWSLLEVVPVGANADEAEIEGVNIVPNGNEVGVKVEQTVADGTEFILCATCVDDPSKYARLYITIEDNGIYADHMTLLPGDIELIDELTGAPYNVQIEVGNGYNAYRLVPTLYYKNYATNEETTTSEYNYFTWEVSTSPIEDAVTPDNPEEGEEENGQATEEGPLPEGCTFDSNTGRLVLTTNANGRTITVKATAKERTFEGDEIFQTWSVTPVDIPQYDPETTFRIGAGDGYLSRGGYLPITMTVSNRPEDAVYTYNIQVEPYNEDSTKWDGSAANSNFDFLAFSELTEFNEETNEGEDHQTQRREEWNDEDNTDEGLKVMTPLNITCSKTLNWSYSFKAIISATATDQNGEVFVAEPIMVTIPAVEVLVNPIVKAPDAIDPLETYESTILRYEDWYFNKIDINNPNVKACSTRRWFEISFRYLELDEEDWASYQIENNYLFLNQVGRQLGEKIVTYPVSDIRKSQGLSGFKVWLGQWEKLANRPVFMNFTVTVKDNNHNAQASETQQFFIVYELYPDIVDTVN